MYSTKSKEETWWQSALAAVGLVFMLLGIYTLIIVLA
jgi:hypothetical protein